LKPNPGGKYGPEWLGEQQALSANRLMDQRSDDLAFAHCIGGAFACLRQTGGMDTIRTYRPEDFSACLALFDGNVPAFFSAEERPGFVRFLTHHAAAWHYRVIERAGEVIACAGYSISTDSTTASLCWGMVHSKLHRQGLGTMLLLVRLEALRLRPDIKQVVLDTSQHTQAFYARLALW
jgi:ribosomal protein S18 acetylase RimI-like enzyme